MRKPKPRKSPKKQPINDASLLPSDSPSEPVPLASPAPPVLVVLPGLKGSLPSPAFFAEQVKKIPDNGFFWLETQEVMSGEDPDYTANPRGVVMRRVARAVEAQLKYARETGLPEEITRLREVARRASQKATIDYIRGEVNERELFLWFASFHLCGRWLEAGDKDEKGSSKEGDKAVFINLPYALPSNPSFFLGQWWVRFLIHSMYDNGEGENIALLLFGKGERGKRRIRTTAPMAQRNWFRILPEVKRLVAQGLSIKPATRRVAKEVHLSPSHVEKLYYQRRIKKSPIS